MNTEQIIQVTLLAKQIIFVTIDYENSFGWEVDSVDKSYLDISEIEMYRFVLDMVKEFGEQRKLNERDDLIQYEIVKCSSVERLIETIEHLLGEPVYISTP